MSRLLLNTLPLDGIRPILSYVDIISLIKLYATFDRKIQTLLSCPNAFAYLSIKAAGKGMPRAPYRYFVSSIRNVAYLKLENDVQWSPASISLLLTLNPRHLELGDNILHDSVSLMLADFAKDRTNEVLRSLAKNFNRRGLPNFPLLTPRLETLIISRGSFKLGVYGLTVPDTLTTLKVPEDFSVDSLLFQMPPSITHLALKDSYLLDGVAERFKALQTLSIRTNNGQIRSLLSPSFSFPLTLDTLELDVPPFEDALFDHPAFRRSSVSVMKLSGNVKLVDPSTGLGLAQWLPSTLKTLRLDRMSGREAEDKITRSLPPSLTSLAIHVSMLGLHSCPMFRIDDLLKL